MSAETLLNQLHKVRKSGPDSWMACCPSHEDRTPSLRITEGSDGHILIHCFAGCSAMEVMGAAGLEMTDLFPERDQHYFDDRPPEPQPRETRGEADLVAIQIRYLTADAMMEGGHRFTAVEKRQITDDRNYLKSICKIPKSIDNG